MKIKILLGLLLLSSVAVGQTYYVSATSLNLRSSASAESKVLETLSQYSNVELIEDGTEWVKVKYGGKTGYAFKRYLKKGKAITSTSSYRTGAICRDGTRSSATGRGACSHHGGVSSWVTKTTVSLVRIENN